MVSELNLAIAGSGGDGVITIGEFLTASVAREGLHVMNIKSYGPQIRGGESSTRLHISNQEVLSQGDHIDVMVIFNWKDFGKFQDELPLRKKALVLYEVKDKTDPHHFLDPKEHILYPIPFTELAREAAGTTLAKNVVCLGAICQLFNLPAQGISEILERKFSKKGPKIVVSNLKALEAGKRYALDLERKDDLSLEWSSGEPPLVMTGNEALSYGALYAGCRFYAGYPITPSSEILEWMAEHLPQFGGMAVQPEDEMAAMGMVLGAAYGGIKAMTSTSGPGFSLMCEMIGLASMMELPMVVVDVQRVGPSTGIPTKTEQSDLNIALYGAHGDSPRVVLAPCDVDDCFTTAVKAFYIAEKHQMPVIILSDQFLAQRKETLPRAKLTTTKGFSRVTERLVPPPNEMDDYLRFRNISEGVSYATYPGIEGGMYNATGIEHNEHGDPTSDAQLHHEMSVKRYAKWEAIARDFIFHRRYGPEKTKVAVLTWGSTKGAVKEAVDRLNAQGHAVSAFIPQVIMPLPTAQLKAFLEGVETLVVVELSHSKQFLSYVRSQVDLPGQVISINRAGGQPFTPGELEEQLAPLFTNSTTQEVK